MMKEQRTFEQIRRHYEIEKKLAERLRNSTRQERKALYASLNDELFRQVPDHPMLKRKSIPQNRARKVAYEMRNLCKFLSKDTCFVEIGPGDCALSLQVAKLVKRVYAVDVCQELTKGLAPPPNFELILSDGCDVPVPANSVDVAYSNQLMEHLHPDDVLEQLQNIYTALAPGGVYLCITPNRLNGPHDVSKYFDNIATGFHLKEYTVTELDQLFRTAGFVTVRVYFRVKRICTLLPVSPVKLCEISLSILPCSIRRAVASIYPVALLLDIKLVGIK